MAFFILIGLAITSILIIAFIFFGQKTSINDSGLSWKQSILNGLQIYIISLFLGAFFTVIFRYLYENTIAEISMKFISEIFGLFMYAVIFTVFIVLPALIIGIKLISKSNKSIMQKEIRFAVICIILVLIVNLILEFTFASKEIVIFLLEFSFFGIVTPLITIRINKIFG